jgi:hypothetical protein
VETAPRFVFPRLTRFIKKLIIALLSAFVIELVLINFVGFDVFNLLALNTSHIGIHTVWQMFTYVLVDHPQGVISMLIGLLFIWLILSPFEMSYGQLRTVQLCGVAVLSASIPAVAVGLLLPGLASGPSGLFGSHPIAYAGMAAMAVSVSGRRLSLFGVFSMTSNQLLWLLVGFSVLMFLATKNTAMLVGSLGAIAAGVGFVRWMKGPGTRRRTTRKRGPFHRFKIIEGGGDTDDKKPRWLN